MNIENVVRKVEIIGSVQGMGQVALAYDKVTTSADGTTQATARASRAQADVEKALAATQRQLQENLRQQQLVNDMIGQQARVSQQLVAANDNTARSFSVMGLEAAEAANHLRTAATAAYAFSPAFRGVVNGLAAPALSATTTALVALSAGIVAAVNIAGTGLVRLGAAAAAVSPSLAPLAAGITAAGLAMQAFNPTLVSVAGSILTRLLPALRALGAVGLAVNAVQLLGEAWELGGRKLEEYRRIAEKAAAVDLSTTFYQRLIKGAEAAKVPVEDLTRLLQNLQKTAADALGGSALEQRVQKHLDAGNFGGNPGVQLLSQANTTEQRFEAIVTLINKAMESGQRLAALDLAKTAFGPEIAERLRQDSEYLDRILEQSKKVAETELVSAADIGRAAELQARYDAAVKLLEQRWHPIQDLLTQLGIRMHSAWVGIVEAIAQAFDQAAKLVAKIGEISPAFWDYVRRGANALGNAAAVVGPSVPAIGPAIGIGGRLLAGATAQEEARATDAYTQALDRLRAGLQNTKGVQQAVTEATTVANKVYGDTSKTLDNVATSAAAQKNGFDRAVESAEKHIARMQADAQAVGLGAAALEESRTRATLWTAALQAGIPVVGEVARRIDDLAKRAGEAARELAKARIDQSIRFQRDTIGLSAEDVQIAQQLSAIYPKVADALASVEAQQIRVTNAQDQLASGFREVGKEMFTAFVTGKDVMDAMIRSLDALASKLANAGFENLLSGIMSLNPAQAALGAAQAGASALISAFTSDQKANKEVEEARERWEAMADQLKSFNRAAAGFDVGPLTSELENLRQVHDTLAMAALEARDYAALGQVHETLNRGIRRVFGEWMNGIPVLGELSQKIQDLQNEAQGLKDVIPEAAAAIDQGLIARIRQVTEEAERGLIADINSANGMDWLNEAGVAIAKFNDLARRVDPSLLNIWFVVNAQKIIDSSQLTGEAFQTLVTQLEQAVPGISESLHEFTEAITRTAEEIAAVRQSFADQLFILQQDQSTLAGQLAVFDLQAQRAREAEIRAGGEAIVQLEALQAAQRAKIMQDFADQAAAAERQRAEEAARALSDATSFLTGAFRNIQDYINHFNASPASLATPQEQLSNAQNAFAAQLGIINTGSAEQRRAALGSITQYADDAINAIKAVYGSTATGALLIDGILAQLAALPATQRPEDYIVAAIEEASAVNVAGLDDINASIIGQLSTAVMQGSAQNFATALLPHFNSLLDPTSGLLKQAQLEAKLNLPDGSLDKIWKELDGNGNGILEKSELIKAATQGTKTGVDNVDVNTDSLPEQATRIAGMETNLLALAQVSGNTASAANQLATLNNAMTVQGVAAGEALRAMRLMMVEQNLRWGLSSAVPTAIPTYAMGTSFHPGGVAIVGERGPEIVDMPLGSRVIPNHVAFNNDNRPSYPDLFGPIYTAGGEGGDTAAEVRELREEVRQLRAMLEKLLHAGNEISAHGHGQTAAELHRANRIAEETASELRRAS